MLTNDQRVRIPFGLPCRIIDSTFACTFELPRPKAKAKPPPEPKLYPNPVLLAQEWHTLMLEGSMTKADLARKLRVSRARVTQVMNLLDLDPTLAATIVALGDSLPKRVITERTLRPFVDLPVDQQRPKVAQLVRRAKKQLRFAAERDATQIVSEARGYSSEGGGRSCLPPRWSGCNMPTEIPFPDPLGILESEARAGGAWVVPTDPLVLACRHAAALQAQPLDPEIRIRAIENYARFLMRFGR